MHAQRLIRHMTPGEFPSLVATMANGGDNQGLPFPVYAGERDGDTDEARQQGVPRTEGPLILEHQCSEASDCSDKGGNDRARLLVGAHLSELKTSLLDSCEDHEASASLGAASHDDSQMKEMRETLELLQTEMRSEVRELKQEIDSKNKELMKKNEELDAKNKELLKKNKELEEAREERNQLMKRLQWKDEELEHERRSKQWTESELNTKISQLEQEKDKLQTTIKDLKCQMDAMQKEMQLMNNQKASVEDFEELQQKVEMLKNKDCDFPATDEPKAGLEKYTLEFVRNVSLLMQCQGETTVTSYKNGGNGHNTSGTNNDESNNGETRPDNVHWIRTTSDENNAVV